METFLFTVVVSCNPKDIILIGEKTIKAITYSLTTDYVTAVNICHQKVEKGCEDSENGQQIIGLTNEFQSCKDNTLFLC